MFETLSPEQKDLARKWLLLGVSALAIAGVFAFILAMMRTPGIEAYIPFHDLFHTALNIHVNLSVLVWLLSMSAMLCSLITPPRGMIVARAGFYAAALGTVVMALAPFLFDGEALTNDYIPVLLNPLFFLGLSLFGCGIMFQMAVVALQMKKLKGLDYAIYSLAIITLIACLCFLLSYVKLHAYVQHDSLEIRQFYELLFWGGGHILQFTYTSAMVIAWIILAYSSGVDSKVMNLQLQDKFGGGFGLYMLLTIPMPFIIVFYSIDSSEYMTYFTHHMKGVMIVLPLLYSIHINRYRKALFLKFRTPEAASLISSMLLFFAGGMLGELIGQENVTTPAHYHGSIVGVSLALMGLVYYALPRLGLGKAEGKMAFWQPYLYAFGQLLHISGLAWSGGYGVLRKTPGAVVSMQAKMGMGLMGLGGTIAIIGGLLFVIVIVRAIMRNKTIEV